MDKTKSLPSQLGIKSLAELCRRAKIHPNSITPYIKGSRSPYNQIVFDIAQALNIDAELIIHKSSEDDVIYEVKRRLTELLDLDLAVFLSGYRARKTQRKFSDVDLGVRAGVMKIAFSRFAKFKTKLEDVFDDYPISINLINLDLAPREFLLNIAPDLIFISGNQAVAQYFLGYIAGMKTTI